MIRRSRVLGGAAVVTLAVSAVMVVPTAAATPGANGDLVISSTHVGEACPGRPQHVYIKSFGTTGWDSGWTQLTCEAADHIQAAISPAGTMVAYARVTSGQGDIFVIDTDRTDRRQLTSGTADDRNPDWSPDAARIVFESNRSGNFEIWSMTLTGRDLRRLTSSGAQDRDPAWAPDGGRIAFASNRTGNFEIYTMRPDGSDLRRISSNAGDDREPDWAPAGDLLAFASDRVCGGGWSATEPFGVAVTTPTGGFVRCVAGFIGSRNPAWSPDGTRIVFSAETEPGNPSEETRDIYVINRDGTGLAVEAEIDGPEYWVDWQPIVPVPFADVLSSPFLGDVRWVHEEGITRGCAPERYCPDAAVTREQMASFLVRTLRLGPSTRDFFTDDEDSIHEADINSLAAAGLSGGCASNRFCPGDAVSREQMASFLGRALRVPPATTDYFDDDEGSIHEAMINAIAEAGVTAGCAADRYCPRSAISRAQMAALLHRAFR